MRGAVWPDQQMRDSLAGWGGLGLIKDGVKTRFGRYENKRRVRGLDRAHHSDLNRSDQASRTALIAPATSSISPRPATHCSWPLAW